MTATEYLKSLSPDEGIIDKSLINIVNQMSDEDTLPMDDSDTPPTQVIENDFDVGNNDRSIADTMKFLEETTPDELFYDDDKMIKIKPIVEEIELPDVIGDRECFFTPTIRANIVKARKNAIKTTFSAFKQMKLLNIHCFTDKIINGYYSGFIGSVLCIDKNHVMDCFPSMEKKIYWIPSRACKFCTGKASYPDYKDYSAMHNIFKKPRDTIRHYLVTAFK